MAGGAFLSSAILVLLNRLNSSDFISFFRGRDYDVNLLKKLNLKLIDVNKVLDDAEDKQIHNRAVKYWLDELKDTVYDAEDVLDEIATKALRSKVEAEFQSGPNLVKSLISTVTSLLDRGVDSEFKKIINKLDYLVEGAKDVLGLREVAGPNRSQIRLPTTSLVDESRVYGRDNDQEKMKKLLLSDGQSRYNVDVIPIVGMGGVGKTTLAQLLYNDDKLYRHFDMKAWVCVSDVFDVFRITKTLVEKVTGRASDAKDLSFLQVKLKESLSGKKFLIVLDDVWNENYDNWKVLMAPFRFGAHGSKIIITTRSMMVASIMQTVPIYPLTLLSEDECWKLFSLHAFENGGNAPPYLEEVGRQIVKKCGGLPLAAKTLGGLLRYRRGIDEWNNILKSAIWELPEEEGNILPALRLSYHHLPSHLKRCFAYCSIFVKGYEFDMKELVSIWTAEGILEKPKNNKTVEEECYKCFHQLLSRSFFQRAKANSDLFVMHDLVHDLAQHVMGDFCYTLEVGMPIGISEKLRHFSYVRGRFDSFDKLKVIMDAKCLRTFLPMDSKISGKQWLSKKLLDEILLGLRRLRLLSLSRYQIVELPYSIGNLIHLRFLDLSDTLISELPPSVCTLYNLETLLLANCYLLTTLPAKLVKLILLRRLDLSGTNLKEMPMNISRLKDLQQLTVFVVGKCTGIGELGEFHFLRGTISISGLQNVENSNDVLEAKMSEKKHLEKLALEWNSTTEDSQNARDVLEKLKPHTTLKHLKVINYGGRRFPDWLGHQSFDNMLTLCLENCKICFSLPPLGQLPSLKELTVARMPGIAYVGIEFYGESGSLSKPFQSLETLRFEEMSEWVDWCILDAGVFPQLQNLEIIRCPKLIGDLPKVHSLVRLKIKECPELMVSLPRPTSIRELELLECKRLLLEGQDMSSLEIVKISSFASNFASELLALTALTNLKQLEVSWCPKLVFPQCCCTSLERLSFYDCESLISLPLELFPKLRSLEISRCENFENLLSPNAIKLQNLSLLDALYIRFCDKMVSFPRGGLTAPNLSYLWVCDCKKLKALPEHMHTLLPSLQRLMVWNCPEIESFPKGGLPFKLHFLWIWNCKKLVGGRRDWGLQTLPYLTTFILEGESEDVVESFPEEGLLPSTITALEIGDLENLESLNSGLQLLCSLEVMKIRNCPQLISLPKEGLPISLSELLIQNCPLLKHHCRREKGKDWYKIAHIPVIDMDGEVIFDHVSRSTRVTRP